MCKTTICVFLFYLKETRVRYDLVDRYLMNKKRVSCWDGSYRFLDGGSWLRIIFLFTGFVPPWGTKDRKREQKATVWLAACYPLNWAGGLWFLLVTCRRTHWHAEWAEMFDDVNCDPGTAVFWKKGIWDWFQSFSEFKSQGVKWLG